MSDNGIGMPEDVKAKFFQPFFTTKLAGRGGLWIATKEGEGTEFIVALPT